MLPEGLIKASAYLTTGIGGFGVSRHHTKLIEESLQGIRDYQQYWGTVGTDYFGTIAQIGLFQAIGRAVLPERMKGLVHHAVPLFYGTYHTLLELSDFLGLENTHTRGGFHKDDVICYWAAALTMMSLPKIGEKIANKIYPLLEDKLNEVFSSVNFGYGANSLQSMK